MRVATFNVCHGTKGAGSPLDLDALVEGCRSLGADVLALEEVDQRSPRPDGPNQAARVAEALGMAWAWGPAWRRKGVVSGQAILARGAIAEVEVLPLLGHLRRGHRDRRSALLATVDVGQVRAQVAVVHLSLDVADNLAQQRIVLGALAGRPHPQILLGDFNRRTAWVRPDVEQAGLVLAADDVRSAPRTTPHFRIDHIAVAGLSIDSVAVIDTGTSDHRAVVAEVSAAPPDQGGRIGGPRRNVEDGH